LLLLHLFGRLLPGDVAGDRGCIAFSCATTCAVMASSSGLVSISPL
jgi:hypothetical protein